MNTTVVYPLAAKPQQQWGGGEGPTNYLPTLSPFPRPSPAEQSGRHDYVFRHPHLRYLTLGLNTQYLRENEFLRKTILACLWGAQMGLINEKK